MAYLKLFITGMESIDRLSKLHRFTLVKYGFAVIGYILRGGGGGGGGAEKFITVLGKISMKNLQV